MTRKLQIIATVASLIIFPVEALSSKGQTTVPGVKVYNQTNTGMLQCLFLSNITDESVDVTTIYYDHNGDIVVENSVSGDLVTSKFVSNYVEGTTDYTASFTIPADGSGQLCLRGNQATIDTVGKIIIKWSSAGNRDRALKGMSLIQRAHSTNNDIFSDGYVLINGGRSF